MMVHIKPNITGGLPSTMSLALMLTSLICKVTDKGQNIQITIHSKFLLFWCGGIQGQCCNYSKSEAVSKSVLVPLAIWNLRGLPIRSKGQLHFSGPQ